MMPGAHNALAQSVPDLLLHPSQVQIETADGTLYVPTVCANERQDGLWEAWIEFRSADGRCRATDRESTQPNRAAVEYWASGLEPVYYEGAFARALELGA